MPELPEVETVVRDLRPLLIGQRIGSVHVSKKKLRRPWQKKWNHQLLGATVEAIRRRGKWMILDFRDEQFHLLVHLGMSGQFTVVDSSVPRGGHLHVWFGLGDGTNQLRFRDPRRFGSVELFPDEAAVQQFLGDRLGPEPFDIPAEHFYEAVTGTSRTLKAILLDQSVVAGVGNIYADEALHRAGLHPERRGKSLTKLQVNTLREAITTVITHAIDNRGSTIRDYIGGSGLRGNFQNEFRVYGLDGTPCPACHTTIEVLRVAGRSSHFCPKCQPKSARG